MKPLQASTWPSALTAEAQLLSLLEFHSCARSPSTLPPCKAAMRTLPPHCHARMQPPPSRHACLPYIHSPLTAMRACNLRPAVMHVCHTHTHFSLPCAHATFAQPSCTSAIHTLTSHCHAHMQPSPSRHACLPCAQPEWKALFVSPLLQLLCEAYLTAISSSAASRASKRGAHIHR